MHIRYLLILFLFSLITPKILLAGDSFPICNIIPLDSHYQIEGDNGYCLETEESQVTFVNLSSKNIEIIDTNDNSYFVYSNEYLITRGRFVINNSQGVVIGKEQNGVVVARDYSSVQQRAIPLAIWVPSAIGNGILGGMGVVAYNPNATFREISIGVFAGALGGALGPIMGVGQFGVVAGGAIGISAGIGCHSCHM